MIPVRSCKVPRFMAHENSTTVNEQPPGARRPSRVQGMRLREAIHDIHEPLSFVARDGVFSHLEEVNGSTGTALIPPCPLENLGDQDFRRDHGVRYAYIAGAMANGISSAELVEAMGRSGFLGFFGAGGLTLEEVENAIHRITSSLGHLPFGFNLIHSPGDPDLEAAVVDLYLRRGVRLIEASAYLDLTLPVVPYRVHGIHEGPDGAIIAPNRIVAKVSRVEVASRFLAPPPLKHLSALVSRGVITGKQADLASRIPMAQDLTAEADSGGHTDNRSAITLLPALLAVRDRMQAKHGYAKPPRVGAAGGIATPASAAAAFSMGAAYVMTGSVNQACVESGTSDAVRQMLAEAEQADFAMAPAADMFEMGVKVQVLKRGTLFAMRATRLFELYRSHGSLGEIPAADRAALEKTFFRAPLDRIWEETRRFFAGRNPGHVERAEKDPKYKMALVFGWYLGKASHWANSGDPSRKIDYQIWCGPAMGAFNEWVKGSYLEEAKNRRVVPVALNILHGAAVQMRINVARMQGLPLAPDLVTIVPLEMAELEKTLENARVHEG